MSRDAFSVRCPNGGKRAYMTRELAKEALKRMRIGKAKFGYTMPALHVYECPYCKWWHIGSERGSKP